LTDEPVLRALGVSVTFPARSGGTGRRHEPVRAVRNASLEIHRGECVGLVGESGSGKSTLGFCLAGLVAPTAGEIRYAGTNRSIQPVQIVFQDSGGALDPRMRVWESVAEGLDIQTKLPRPAQRERAIELLRTVGLGEDLSRRYPHALSGGQRQRVGIARALATEPEIIVLDEPTSALDMVVQARVLDLLLELQERSGVAFLLITHDIAVAAHLCHRIAVMKSGEIVEQGATEALLARPETEYARTLISSTPTLDGALSRTVQP
jgi:ABC-type glutathione transport system ATPase component